MKLEISIKNNVETIPRLSGFDYPDHQRQGVWETALEFAIDWRTAGFDSVAEFNAWVAASSSTNFAVGIDTGIEAGTGFNHKFILDMPIAQRMGGEPEYSPENAYHCGNIYVYTFDLSGLREKIRIIPSFLDNEFFENVF